MTHNHSSSPESRSPLQQALRESRAIIILAFGIAIIYNVFAATRIDWLREPHKSTQNPLTLGSLEMGDGDTALTPATPPPLDTAVIPVPLDTAATAGLTKAQLDSITNFRKDSIKLAREDAKRIADSTNEAQFDGLVAKLAGVSEIQTDVAKKLFDSKKVTFIDARPEDHFAKEHIRGAMNVYAEQWQTKIPDLVQIDRNRVIITYCGGGDECELSHHLADNLKALGFKNVVVYKGGITDWKAKNHPIAGGE